MKKHSLLMVALLCAGIGAGRAQFTNLHTFVTGTGSIPSGCSLTLSGSKLFGMTYAGGTNRDGVIFSLDTNGSGYKDLLIFNGTNGANPNNGDLTLSGTVLYGMTEVGGANNDGCIFSLDTNGSGYKDLFDFNATNGANPLASLTLSGKKLYGMTLKGGANNKGCIFSLDTNGTRYNDLLDFNGTNGQGPNGSLTLSGNKLYGMANVGGANNKGCLFSLDTNGTGYADLLDFNGTNGVTPTGSLTLSGNKLYGMTELGGAHAKGNIFSIDTNGSEYKDMLDFNTTNGSYPFGSLIISGSVLYGMTENGGAHSGGCIFSIDTNSSGYIDLYNFNGTTGAYPYGSLTLFGNRLYGITDSGGGSFFGDIFSFKDTTITTSINELPPTPSSINLYPNPSNGIFTMQLVETGHALSPYMEVYNVLGEQVKSEKLSEGIPLGKMKSSVIDMSGQPSGIYFYRVVGEDGSLAGSGKIMIDK